MLLYYQSWMFYIHFIATSYHFLALTYWHNAQCQLLFFAFFTSQNIPIKRSPNAVKLFGDFLGPEDNLGAKEAHGGPMGPRRHQGPRGPWHALMGCGAHEALLHRLLALYIPKYSINPKGVNET